MKILLKIEKIKGMYKTSKIWSKMIYFEIVYRKSSGRFFRNILFDLQTLSIFFFVLFLKDRLCLGAKSRKKKSCKTFFLSFFFLFQINIQIHCINDTISSSFHFFSRFSLPRDFRPVTAFFVARNISNGRRRCSPQGSGPGPGPQGNFETLF